MRCFQADLPSMIHRILGLVLNWYIDPEQHAFQCYSIDCGRRYGLGYVVCVYFGGLMVVVVGGV